MIEVEKKFAPSSEIIEQIKNDAIFVASKTMNDVGYDYEDLSLMRNDIWLRKRNGKFDLKVSKNKSPKIGNLISMMKSKMNRKSVNF